jgi:tRNA A-37 threonylcarbamoyl transferase component Bud32
MSSLLGKTLGHYQITAQLGEGGMATVYQAFDARLERTVAIKVIRVDIFSPVLMKQILARFEREAKSLAKLSHPNIVRVIDYGEESGVPYLVMEYLPGGTLKDKMHTRVPWKSAIRLLLPIARALQYAHEQGIIHRDIKPSNILITRSGEPMLTDFGIAKVIETEQITQASALTGTGMAVGTPEYMAPEQWQGQTSFASDIYALGVVLFEMLTGQKPYIADTPAGILIKQASEPPPRPKELVQELPWALENIVLRALQNKPQDRFASMGAFAADLETVLAEASTEMPVVATQMPGRVDRPPTGTLPPTALGIEMPAPGKKKTRLAWGLLLAGLVGGFCLVALSAGVIWFVAQTAKTQPTLTQVAQIPPTTQSVQIASSATAMPAAKNTEQPALEPPTATLPVLEVNGPSATPIPTDTATPTPTQPSGPTGKIVYTCQVDTIENHDQICVINPDGSGFRQLTNDLTSENFYPSLAPDGNSLVYSSNRTGTFEIYESDLLGNAQQISSGLGDCYGPEISPDGRLIAFARDEGDTQGIWVMDRNGQNPRLVYRLEGKDALDPTWSPDGRLMFALGIGENKQLYVIDVNGNGLALINSTFTTRGRNDWSPDGKLITAYAGATGDRKLFIMNADGTGLVQVSAPGSNSLAPSFSPDSQWITFMSYMADPTNFSTGCEIYIMRIDGSDIRRVTENAYCDYQPRWGP